MLRRTRVGPRVKDAALKTDVKLTERVPGESAMNARDLNRYKRLLLAKQRELSIDRPVLPAAGGAQGDLIDEANLDAEADLQIKVRQTDVRLLRAIEEALTRIKRGTFGICEVCQRPISQARLKAVPWTRLCLDCKEHEHA
jgi:DnaK suppressor protein